MPHQNSVFHQVVDWVLWDALEAAVQRHDAARRARSFSFESQFAALLYGQLSGATSLREIEQGLHSHADRLYHLGIAAPRRSSLAEANRQRPAAVFADVLAATMARADRGLRRRVEGVTLLVDSTSLPLNALSGGWATFSAKACGAKLHVVYDPDADCPVYSMVTAANVNDVTPAQEMPITPGATYVWDLGYYDFGLWAKFDDTGCRVVTRLKKNTPLRVSETRDVPDGGDILSDCLGTLPGRLARSRRNPMHKPVREIRVRIDSGKVLRIVTNDVQATARDIADLYKRRWAIELFFRWIKQNLRLRKFLGTSENAVRIQIAVALIAFLLLRMLQSAHSAVKSPLDFARLIRAHLMSRRPIRGLEQPSPRKSLQPAGQAVLL